MGLFNTLVFQLSFSVLLHFFIFEIFLYQHVANIRVYGYFLIIA